MKETDEAKRVKRVWVVINRHGAVLYVGPSEWVAIRNAEADNDVKWEVLSDSGFTVVEFKRVEK